MNKVYLAGYECDGGVSCWAIFVRESDRKVRIALTDAVSRLGFSIQKDNKGVRTAVPVSIETSNYDETGAFKVAKLLERTLPDTADGWLALSTDEAVALIQQAAGALDVALEQPYREQYTWLP
jgi:hypothetical protein